MSSVIRYTRAQHVLGGFINGPGRTADYTWMEREEWYDFITEMDFHYAYWEMGLEETFYFKIGQEIHWQ